MGKPREFDGLMGFYGFYPLGNELTQRTGKIHHAVNGKTHDFDQQRTVSQYQRIWKIRRNKSAKKMGKNHP